MSAFPGDLGLRGDEQHGFVQLAWSLLADLCSNGRKGMACVKGDWFGRTLTSAWDAEAGMFDLRQRYVACRLCRSECYSSATSEYVLLILDRNRFGL